ncbi:MAG: DUF4248 domain-containing protein [Bacteroidota bacterium]
MSSKVKQCLLYFPNSNKQSASTQLGRWVRQHEKLQLQLLAMGYKPRKKILTPSQLKFNYEIIWRALTPANKHIFLCCVLLSRRKLTTSDNNRFNI